jgi:hypothetical protein
MGLMKFLCCLFPGRCRDGESEPRIRTQAATAATDVQPNAPKRPSEPPSSGEPEELPGGPS